LAKYITSATFKYPRDILVSEDKAAKYHVINTAYVSLNKDFKKGMIDVNYSGTTNVSVLLYGNKLLCINVGDSRAVLGSLKTIQESLKIE